MKIQDFSFLADENIHNDVVAFLRQEGLEILHVKEKAELRGTDDSSLMKLAYENDMAILTHDSDFGFLAFVRNEPLHLILYVRPGHFDPQFTIQSLEQLFAKAVEIFPPTLMKLNRVGESISVRIRGGEF